MNGLRSWLTLLTAIVTIAFAGTAAADAKKWSIAASPSTFTTTTDVKVTITVTNQTPGGNSNINSLKIALPAGYTINTSHADGAPVTTTWPGQLNWTAQSGVIAFSNMAPLPRASFDIVAYLNIDTGTAGCTANVWPGFPSTRAFTGSSFTGDDFTLASKPTTNVSAVNALTFQSVPSSVAVGTAITGSVHATSCGSDKSGVSVSVTLGSQPSGGVTGSNGLASFNFSTSALTPATYTITASAAGYTPIMTNVVVCGNTLAFTTQPANVKSGDPTSATVQAKSCGTVTSNVSVTAQVNDSAGHAVGSPQTLSTAASGNVTFQFTPTAFGTYTIAATAANYTGATSNAFKVLAGILNCNDPIAANFINPQNLAPDQPGYAAGSRNPYNKDGVSEQCMPVLYTFTNNILNTDATGNTVNLTWDTSSQPNAAFEYTLNWQAQAVEAASALSGWPMTIRPSVAWLDEDGSETTGLSTNPAFVPGLACLGNKLPSLYGTLVNGVDEQPGTTSLTVTGITSNPSVINAQTNTPYARPVPGDPAIPEYPFPIVIANSVSGQQSTDTERMLVTGETARASNSGVWTITFTVQRGNGMTQRGIHGAGYRVMSTPLPLIPTDDAANFPAGGIYAPGSQAHMCIASHGFTAFSFDGGRAHVLYKTHVLDVGDGWVLGR